MRRLVLLVLIGLAVSEARAQQLAPPPDTLVAADYDAFTFVPSRTDASRSTAATLQFEFELAGFPPAAEAAIRFAGSLWASHLESNVPVRVRASFEDLAPRTLGAAGPACVESRPDLPIADTWYPVALAEALLGTDLNPPGSPICSGVDITATFNRALDADEDGVIDWYYGTDGNPPAGRYDFVTVVLHELAHGLGFLGSFDVATEEEEARCPEVLGSIPIGSGCWGIDASPLQPLVFDRFAEDAQSVPLLDPAVYPNPSSALGTVLQSESVRFDGPTALTANGTLPLDLYAPSAFEPGSSFSHLDEDVSPPGDPNSLMTPQLARAEAIFSPGPFTCAVMGDLGWTLGPDCASLLEGGLAGVTASTDAGSVVLTFQLGLDSEFTSAVVEQEGDDGQFRPVVADVGPLDPSAARSYTVRLGPFTPGRYRFRLRLLRANGESVLSRILTVSVVPDTPLAVFPNPFVDRASVVVDLSERGEDAGEPMRVDVYDVLGRRVARLHDGATGTGGVLELSLDGRGLAAGVYIVRAEGASLAVSRTVTRAQ